MRGFLYSLLCLTPTISFSQTQFVIESSFSENQAKEFMQNIEQYVPDTYSRSLEANLIRFSTEINYSTTYIDSIAEISGILSGTVTKTRGPARLIEKVGGTNCGVAEQLCTSSSLPGNSSGFGNQELNGTNQGCLGSEHQSSWYYVNIQTGGSLSFRINPSSSSDYDFALWGPFTSVTAAANCPPITTPVRCSFAAGGGVTGIRVGESDNSEGSGGDRWVNALNVSAGQVYILLVDNFSSSGVGYTFDFNWSGNTTTAVIGCTPVVLPVEMSSFTGSFYSNANLLNWSTETELNNDYFQLEWTTTPSEDNSWSELDKIDGAGESESELIYSINHYTYTRNAINYYRIKQVDYNGQIRTFPDIVAIDNRQKSEKLVKVVNLLGQEVSESEKGLVIYVYDDGSIEKRIN